LTEIVSEGNFCNVFILIIVIKKHILQGSVARS